jgi:hypothetical protein
VVEEKPVEQDFVAVLQGAQIDVPLEVVVLSLVGLISADYLSIEALDVRRKQSVQAEHASLFLRERRTFV